MSIFSKVKPAIDRGAKRFAGEAVPNLDSGVSCKTRPTTHGEVYHSLHFQILPLHLNQPLTSPLSPSFTCHRPWPQDGVGKRRCQLPAARHGNSRLCGPVLLIQNHKYFFQINHEAMCISPSLIQGVPLKSTP